MHRTLKLNVGRAYAGFETDHVKLETPAGDHALDQVAKVVLRTASQEDA